MEHDYSGVITLIILVAVLLSLFVFNRHTDYAQFCKQVKNLPDTLEEACKYYQEINPRN